MDYRQTNILAQSLGFGLGSILSALLLVLVYQSGGRDRRPRFLFAACILIADGAGLTKNLALLVDPTQTAEFELRVRAIGFAAGALCPLGIIPIWRSAAISEARRRVGDWVVRYSVLSGILIALLLLIEAWVPRSLGIQPGFNWFWNQNAIGNLTLFNGLLTLVVGGLVLLPGALKGPTDQIAVTLMIAGMLVCTGGAVIFIHASQPAAQLGQVARFQGILLLVLGALFYFSHFRAADIFAKYALRVLLATSLSVVAAVALMRPLYALALRTTSPADTTILASSVLICACIALYTYLGKWTDVIVERRIFGKRDPRQVIRAVRHELGLLHASPDVSSLVQSVAANALAMKQEDIWVGRRTPSEIASFGDTSVLIPLSSRSLQHGLWIQGDQRTLLTSEIDLLNEVAFHAGRRLDDLEREGERVERVRTEERLGKQLVEAELRALRSQINPHFLFNALNTIASLIPSEPDKAEEITVRLSRIFRYVLIHSDRPYASLGEEVEFLRAFLEIEQIRFGDRLTVEFDIEPAAETAAIPSLILQPLIENAIKHGIAPKIGKSRLTVAAQYVGNMVRIVVEDDGVGLSVSDELTPGSKGRLSLGTGIGLRNIRERLNGLYGHSASLELNEVENAGVRATITLPARGGNDEDSRVDC